MDAHTLVLNAKMACTMVAGVATRQMVVPVPVTGQGRNTYHGFRDEYRDEVGAEAWGWIDAPEFLCSGVIVHCFRCFGASASYAGAVLRD